MTTSSTMAGHSPPIEIDIGSDIWALAFTVNGKYLVRGEKETVRVLRMKDRKQMATMRTRSAQCLAVSKDGRWIAAGTWLGDVIVWDTKTYKEAFALKKDDLGINGVDFSPDSARLVAASSNHTAIVWDSALRKQVQTLRHEGTKSVRVWDSNDGCLLVDIPLKATALLWFNNHLYVISDSAIKQFEASTGSVGSEWPVSDAGDRSCIALPKHGEFIAYSTKRTITFWDTSTDSQLGVFQHTQDIRSIALSHDDRFLVIGGEGKKTTIKSVSGITNSIPMSPLHTTFQKYDFWIDDAALEQDQLAKADALLTEAIHESRDASHDVLAGRAVVRVRLQQWDAALVDAEMVLVALLSHTLALTLIEVKAINVQPSVFGYIAKSMALVGKGEKHKGYQACDMAFERFHSSHGTFILLIKAIIVFMAGEQRGAISRAGDLIATVQLNSICYVVQAYMYLLLGNSQMETSDYEGAIQSFEHARDQMRYHTSRPLFVVSLISGWKFDDLGIMIRRHLCEALYAAGRTKDAVECFCKMEETRLHGEHLEWAHDFSKRSFNVFKHLGDTAVDAQRYEEAISHYSTALSLNPPSPQDVLAKRIKAFMATGCWKQAADDANQLITLDPLSSRGYEMKHAALYKAGDYDNAVDVLEAMLSKLAQAPDPEVQQLCDRYISPSSTRATIRKIVHRTIRHSPRVLINTTAGRLHDRAEQASAFETSSIFNKLVSSMTTRIDYVRIKREVRQYFRYVMLSHRWEENE
ncbi:WD40 repeat-like protein, partial [Imleria badia]